MTPYSKEWDAFKKTIDYKKCVAAMKKSAMRQPYIDNILRLAFDAGWNSELKKF